MDLRPLALALALIAPAANAACESWMATGSTNWIRECNGGVDPYPQTPDHGTRTDVYLDSQGRVTGAYKHQVTSPGDNLRVYSPGLMLIDELDAMDELDEDFDE